MENRAGGHSGGPSEEENWFDNTYLSGRREINLYTPKENRKMKAMKSEHKKIAESLGLILLDNKEDKEDD